MRRLSSPPFPFITAAAFVVVFIYRPYENDSHLQFNGCTAIKQGKSEKKYWGWGMS
jgi:hypothetical protein